MDKEIYSCYSDIILKWNLIKGPQYGVNLETSQNT